APRARRAPGCSRVSQPVAGLEASAPESTTRPPAAAEGRRGPPASYTDSDLLARRLPGGFELVERREQLVQGRPRLGLAARGAGLLIGRLRVEDALDRGLDLRRLVARGGRRLGRRRLGRGLVRRLLGALGAFGALLDLLGGGRRAAQVVLHDLLERAELVPGVLLDRRLGEVAAALGVVGVHAGELRGVADVAAVADRHAPQQRQRGALAARLATQVHRLQVEDAVAHRQRQQVAPFDVGALLLEQSELLGHVGGGGDDLVHLAHRLVVAAGDVVDHQLRVAVLVVVARHEARQRVLAVARHVG